MISISEKQLTQYMSLFKGRDDIYARRWEKSGKTGYAPAYSFDWNEYLRHKASGGNFYNFDKKKKIPLTRDVIKKHLIGTYFIGIYPLLEDNTSYFIAIDFDGKDWKKDSKKFIGECKALKISAYIERSLSGKGAHVWIFFKDKYSAVKSRRIFLEIVRKALDLSNFDREVSFDRIFPNQDYHSGKGFGNLIALPLNGRFLEESNMVFLDPGSLNPVSDQWDYLNKIKKISRNKLNNLYEEIIGGGLSDNINNISENKENFKTGKLLLIVKNQIILNKKQITKDLADFLKKNLIFMNTEYIIKKKIGRSVYNIEKYFNLIRKSKDSVMIPRGFLFQLVDFCTEKKISFEILDKRKKIDRVKFNSRIQLKSQQQQVIDICGDKQEGVIVAPPGFGKTIIGIELIARKCQPALIIVHRKQIFDQWVDRIQDFLGLIKKDIGLISGSKKKISKYITVAMVQSLAKYPGLKDLSESFGTIIIDECHHIPAKSFRKVITDFNPYYMFGLTATPQRKYNDEKMIFLYIGDIICNAFEINQDTSKIPGEGIILNIRDTNLYFPYDNKTDDFQILSKVMIFDSARNRLITEDIKKELGPGIKILVLTERKEHVEVLNIYLKSLCEVISITGDDSRSSREIKMKQIEAGNFQVLITTGQLLGEGLDIGNLNSIFLVYPFSFEGKLIQYIGRILRARGRKSIYDYNDKNIDFLLKLYKKRERYYRKAKIL
jgi:superfamily II DNA or RNA helicase